MKDFMRQQLLKTNPMARMLMDYLERKDLTRKASVYKAICPSIKGVIAKSIKAR